MELELNGSLLLAEPMHLVRLTVQLDYCVMLLRLYNRVDMD